MWHLVGESCQASDKRAPAASSDVQEKLTPVTGLPPRQRVIRFADDEVPAAAPEQTAAIPAAASAVVSASSAPTAAPASASLSPSTGSTSKLPDSRRDKDEESISVEAAPVAPKPTTLQQKMLAMAGQDIDQFMREVSCVMFLVLVMASAQFMFCCTSVAHCKGSSLMSREFWRLAQWR